MKRSAQPALSRFAVAICGNATRCVPIRPCYRIQIRLRLGGTLRLLDQCICVCTTFAYFGYALPDGYMTGRRRVSVHYFIVSIYVFMIAPALAQTVMRIWGHTPCNDCHRDSSASVPLSSPRNTLDDSWQVGANERNHSNSAAVTGRYQGKAKASAGEMERLCHVALLVPR